MWYALLYLWAALTVGLILWLTDSWKTRESLFISLGWPIGPVLYLLIKWGSR